MLRFGSIFPLLLSLLRERPGATDRRDPGAITGLGRARHRLAALTTLALLLALAPGCAEDPAGSDERSGDAPGERTGKASAPLVGVDGALTVNTVNTVVNQYAVLGADAAVGANSIGVTAIGDLTSATLGPLSAGDLVMIIQMQGATIDASDTAQYGTVTALNNAGRYEIIGVAGTTGNTINLNTSCGGLKYAYTAAGHVQVVRVPQFTTLTVAAAGSITAPAWDGQRGGVVAVHAQSTVTLNGLVDVSGKGFRGGAAENNSANPGSNVVVFRSAADTDGAEKGEGIAGYQAAYVNGRYGRGAPANAGGGGNSHNAGGGGGANAKNNPAATWTGQGVMNGLAVGFPAWLLDPAYMANGNALTTSSGGGRGGYTYGANNANALGAGPGNALWGGDNRRQAGGLGGRPLDPDPSGRIFFGGGGGAGDGNNGGAGSGGIGGGIAIIVANTVNGTSAIRANGANGTVTSAGGNDAPGGGGGGGTILVNAATITAIAIEAKGGLGGNQIIAGNESEGPGGGGGGGYVLVAPAALPATVTIAGGAAGTTNSGALTEFPVNGATDGNAGTATNAPATISACIDVTAPDTTIATFEPNPTNDPTGDFVFTSNDATATFECSIDAGPFTPCPATFSTSALADGSHTLLVRAKDQAGNVDPTPASYTWTVDTTAPDTTIVTGPPNPSASSAGNFSLSSNDPTATFECSFDGGIFAPCTAIFSSGPFADGPHSLAARAKDAAGNLDATPAVHNWVVDTTAPDTTIVTFEPDPTQDPTGDFTFSSNDPTATFQCSIDGGAFLPCPATFSTNALADGQHTILVRAKDAAGNVDATPASYTWIVDTTPPDTTIVMFEPDPTGDPTGDFGFSSNDPTAIFECSVDGAAFTPCPATFSTNALADGQHTILVRAKDPAGNVDPTPASYTWTILQDTDGDGLTDVQEVALGTNPNDADSDDDGVLDGAEPSFGVDSDGDGLINALDPDSDNDGLFDGTELGVAAPSAATNVGAGNFIPDADPSTTTDPLNPDTDGGTVKDGVEDANHNGKVDVGERNPNDPADDIDTDGDGIGDPIEVQLGTEPNDADSDDDGVLDGPEPSYAQDSDGDGLINALDPESDNDVLFDRTELGTDCSNAATNVGAHHCTPDADQGATVTDPLDADTDDGSVPDGSEDANLDGAIDPGETDPTAGHGADDVGAANVDADGDGLSDAVELFIGSDPNDADTDDDGLLDGQEANPADDTDGDGLVNVLDPDSDDDGLFDGTELGEDCSSPATDAAAGVCIPDGDAGATKTSPLLKDTDGGGVIDGAEDLDHDGALDAGEIDPTAGHGADDATFGDADNDGLGDALELQIGSDPNDADSDDDGVLDGQEPNFNEDTDGDGLLNVLDPDSDNDGLFDGTEMGKGCGNAATDVSKMRCVADADGGATTTSPLLVDTDGGGVSDGNEDTNHNGFVDPGERNPTAGNGADDLTGDTDGDGLTDGFENGIGTDPNDADTDDDGLLDGAEIDPDKDTDGDGLINALDPDSDNDGLFDGTEAGQGCANADTDAGAGHCVADADGGLTVTSPVDADTDGGTVSDGSEDVNHDGAIDPGETNPTLGHADDDLQNVDTDGDGLGDALELNIGTDPNDADTDDDGVIDGKEPNPTDDTDGDGLINALDPDSDGDGLFDGTELGLDCSDAATDASKMTCIADADPGTKTSPLLVDTDGGTVGDGVEDANHNGKIDPGETDPNDPADDVPVTGCTGDGDCGNPTSGQVCDPATKTCIDGCHTPGNGCPSDLVCTSDTAAIGSCVECVDDTQCGDAQSGKVCEDHVCVSGCHDGGNGCPDGQECTSTTIQIGTCETPQTTTTTPEDDEVFAEGGGCVCTTRPANDNGGPGVLLALAVGGLLATRRRRRSR